VKKIRIRNFQCVADSGEIVVDEQLTIFVGENESGKSAILKALDCFNVARSFQDEDICTLTRVALQLHSGKLDRRDIPIVDVWVDLEERDVTNLRLPKTLPTFSCLRITKSLSGEYVVCTSENTPLLEAVVPALATAMLERIEIQRRALEQVYCGSVYGLTSGDERRVFLRREDDSPSDSVVLFKRDFGNGWKDLRNGSLVQVTTLSPAAGPKARWRATAVGFAVDLEPVFINLCDALQEADLKRVADGLDSFGDLLEGVSRSHPLRDGLSDTLSDLREVLDDGARLIADVETIAHRVIEALPPFLYLPSIESIPDSISLSELSAGRHSASVDLFAALLELVSFSPADMMTKNRPSRLRTLKERSKDITRLLREGWFRSDLEVEFQLEPVDGETHLTLTVESAKSEDPPSRRSQGFISYLSLFAKLAEVKSRVNTVLLLDDPGLHLHAVAQKKLTNILESHPHQILLATQLPFMINPDRLERVRVVTRDGDGTHIEDNWSKAQRSLLPVWGSLIGAVKGRLWLVVEGPSDSTCFSVANEFCKKTGRRHLGEDVTIIPGGGSATPFVVQALWERGIPLIVILDGDYEGNSIRDRIKELTALEDGKIITLSAALGTPDKEMVLEDLFSEAVRQRHRNLKKAIPRILSEAASAKEIFDNLTLESFESVFTSVNRALAGK
jgi:AAA ATPase domain